MKTLFLFASLTLLSNAASAQFSSAGISARAGLSYISLKTPATNATNQSDPLFCFQSGVFTEYKLSKHASLLAEFNFLVQRGKVTANFTNIVPGDTNSYGTDIIITRLDYLSFPVCFGYSIRHFTMKGGIQAGYAVRQRAFENGIAYSGDSTITFSNTFTNKLVNNFDFGICIGAQEDISNRIFVSVSAYQSLRNIVIDKSPGFVRKNSNVVVGLGYRIIKVNNKEGNHKKA
ncbi:MAG: porin family protein [Chitinophagales bacterium]